MRIRSAASLLVLAAALCAQAQPAPDTAQVIIPNIHRRHLTPYRAPIELTGVNANIEIRDGVSTTTLELTLSNPGSSQQEARLILPVPDGVTVSRLQYDGVGPEPVAQVLPRDEARRIYDAIVAGVRDPALVEFVGWNLIRTSAFPIPPGRSQKLSLTYEQVLPVDAERTDYVLPRSEALAASGVEWSIKFDIHSRHPIATVFSPSNEVVTDRHDANHVSGRIIGTRGGDRGSFRLSYLTEKHAGEQLALSVLAFPDPSVSHDGGGYFMLLATPGATRPRDEKPTPREVTLVIDRSGSMRGDKFTQARAAAKQVVQGLSDGEFFNIIDYSDNIDSYAKTPVAKSTQSLNDALAYLDRLEVNGGTNIHDALLEALRPRPAADGTLPLVLFLTDGLPTVGERNEVRIRDDAKKANAFNRRIFTFGVGLDVNSPLLSNLAKSSRATSTFVLPNEDVETAVSQVYRRLKGPVVTLPELSVATQVSGANEQTVERADKALRDVLPRELPDIFEGDQLVVLGQYTGDTPFIVQVRGQGQGKRDTATVRFDPSTASARNSYIPRLWANRKVAALVEEIRQASAEGAGGVSDARLKELSDEITRLSIKYGILTEHTAFLAREPESPVDFDNASRRTQENLGRRAVASPAPDRPAAGRSGSSVAQERDIALKSAAHAAAPAQSVVGAYVSPDQKKEKLETVQAIADLTFFRRSNRWVDSRVLDKADAEPDRTVTFGTPEYAKVLDQLVAENRQAALAQEGDILIQLGKERILIKQQ